MLKLFPVVLWEEERILIVKLNDTWVIVASASSQRHTDWVLRFKWSHKSDKNSHKMHDINSQWFSNNGSNETFSFVLRGGIGIVRFSSFYAGYLCCNDCWSVNVLSRFVLIVWYWLLIVCRSNWPQKETQDKHNIIMIQSNQKL